MLNYVSFFLYFTVNHLRVSLSSNYLPSLPIQIVLILQYQSNIWTHLHFVAFLYFYYLGIAEKKFFFKYLNHKIAVYSKHKSVNKKDSSIHRLIFSCTPNSAQFTQVTKLQSMESTEAYWCFTAALQRWSKTKRKNTTEASSSLIDTKGCFTKPLLDF